MRQQVDGEAQGGFFDQHDKWGAQPPTSIQTSVGITERRVLKEDWKQNSQVDG